MSDIIAAAKSIALRAVIYLPSANVEEGARRLVPLTLYKKNSGISRKVDTRKFLQKNPESAEADSGSEISMLPCISAGREDQAHKRQR